MQRFDTRVFLIAASVLVAGCGGGGGGTTTVAAPAAPQNPAAPANNGANGANGADGKDALAESAEDAAKDGFEAGLDYGQALAEAKDKGEDPPERPENPFLDDGETLSEDEIDSACRKVGDEVEPTEEAMDPEAEEGADPDAEEPDAEEPEEPEEEDKGYDAAAAGQDVDTEAPDAEAPDAEDPDAEDPDAEDPDAEEPDAEEPDAEDPDAEAPDEEDPDAEEPDAEEDDSALDADTKRRLAAVWECAFEQGTEAGEVIYAEGALGDAENEDGGIGLEDSGESDEDDGDDPDAEDPDAEQDPQAANCGEGSEYAPLSKLKVERVDGSVRVEVEGTTPTGGFTDAKLVTTTEELDDEGVLHLVFCIKPPPEDAAVTSALVKHTAIFMWARDHEKVTRVIVEGKSTSKQKSVEALEESDEDE